MGNTNQVRVKHTTEYLFDRSVAISPHLVQLRPAAHCRSPILSYSLLATPSDHYVHWQQDPFGNYLARFIFSTPSQSLRFDVDMLIDVIPYNPFDFFIEFEAAQYPFNYSARLRRDLSPYIEVTEPSAIVGRWADKFRKESTETVDFLVALNQSMKSEIEYIVRLEPGIQSCEETLNGRRGSCRDISWLLIQVLRELGLASRFVSGYLVEVAGDSKIDATQSAANLHAWVEVYITGAGWIGLDPTSGMLADAHHIPLACAPWPDSVAPIIGATEPCEVEFKYSSSAEKVA